MLDPAHYLKINPMFAELTYEDQQQLIKKENTRLSKLVDDKNIKTVIAQENEFCRIITVDDEDKIFFSTHSKKPPVIFHQRNYGALEVDRTEPDVIPIWMHIKGTPDESQVIHIERETISKLIAVLQNEIGL